MKRTGLGLGVLLLMVALVGWWFLRQQAPPSTEGSTTPSREETVPPSGIRVVTTPVPQAPSPESTPDLIGEEVLRDYGDPGMTPVNDLKLLGGLLSNMALLVKNVYRRPMSGNEDWAEALRGSNPAQQRFLPDDHRIFNSDGLLVDRWGSPLFFHPVGEGKFEIRSAGPDRKLWTTDDVQRDSDGSFRGPETLNRPGLYDPAPSPVPIPR